jgi:penicillin-binding protein 2
MAESCDVWYYHLARRLEIERMAKVAKQFGLSQRTGIDLPGEAAGIMPDPEWRKKVNPKDPKWYPGYTINTSIGQGDVMTTPLQMAMISAGVANYGKIYRPYVLDTVLDRSNEIIDQTKPEVRHQVKATQEQFQKVINAMLQTVESGTGRVCKIEGMTVGGKTGSAQNPHGVAHGWFISFAPGSNTEIAIACIVENGAHGATTAAPVCRAIMDVYFGKKKPEEIEPRKSHVSGD